jgi:hypothetical protein
MIKVFEDFDLSLVGRMQSLLESEGIETFLKNQYSSGVLGELPFVEIVPQLYIIEEKNIARARALLQAASVGAAQQTDSDSGWTCASCAEKSEGNFDSCWNCGAARQA